MGAKAEKRDVDGELIEMKMVIHSHGKTQGLTA